jgi:hypothetical protein
MNDLCPLRVAKFNKNLRETFQEFVRRFFVVEIQHDLGEAGKDYIRIN